MHFSSAAFLSFQDLSLTIFDLRDEGSDVDIHGNYSTPLVHVRGTNFQSSMPCNTKFTKNYICLTRLTQDLIEEDPNP